MLSLIAALKCSSCMYDVVNGGASFTSMTNKNLREALISKQVHSWKLNTSPIVSFSHIIPTACCPSFLGWWTSKRQAVRSLVENKIRTQVIYSLFLHPWQGYVTRIAKMVEGVSSSSPDTREDLPPVPGIGSIIRTKDMTMRYTCNSYIWLNVDMKPV